jgi:NAD(P)-dependent dehydrogenase (short-subunit alcohol dehydrogenase family)
MWPKLLVKVANGAGRAGPGRLAEAVAGKTVLVTGASYGIGEATARRLAAAGATVLLVARSADRIEELACELRQGQGTARAYPADLSDQDSVDELIKRILEEHDHVDVLINNAGKSIRRAIVHSYDRMHDFERTINVNYLGPVRLTLGLLPSMRARGSGHLINVSTTGIRLAPAPRWSAYQASKAAFDMWSRAVAAEVLVDGVRTSTVYMGLVRTRMSAPTRSLGRLPGLSPHDAAGLVCDAIVYRSRSIGPWWLPAADVFATAMPGPVGSMLSGIYRLTKER